MPLLLVAGLALSLVAAQPEPGSDFEAGRRNFEAGLGELDAGRFEAAAAAFEASLQVRESPPALYNLGLAYRRLGRLSDALRTFERFLDLSAGRKPGPSVQHARALAEELRGALARVDLEVEGPVSALSVDTRTLPARPGVVGLVLDPGEHVIRATADDGRIVERRAHLARGAALKLSLDLRPPPPPPVAPQPPPAAPAASADGPRWWLWVGLGVVLVAGGATAAVLATRDSGAPPLDGGTTGVVLRGLGGR